MYTFELDNVKIKLQVYLRFSEAATAPARLHLSLPHHPDRTAVVPQGSTSLLSPAEPYIRRVACSCFPPYFRRCLYVSESLRCSPLRRRPRFGWRQMLGPMPPRRWLALKRGS